MAENEMATIVTVQSMSSHEAPMVEPQLLSHFQNQNVNMSHGQQQNYHQLQGYSNYPSYTGSPHGVSHHTHAVAMDSKENERTNENGNGNGNRNLNRHELRLNLHNQQNSLQNFHRHNNGYSQGHGLSPTNESNNNINMSPSGAPSVQTPQTGISGLSPPSGYIVQYEHDNNSNNSNNNNNNMNGNNNMTEEEITQEAKERRSRMNLERNFSIASALAFNNNNNNNMAQVIRLSEVIGARKYKHYIYNNKRQVYCASKLTLLSVDLVNQTFEAEVELHVFWLQPQLSSYISENDGAGQQISWTLYDDGKSIPIDLDDPFEGDLNLEWIEKEFHYHFDTGCVEMLLHLKDKFGERMELARFPVDRQFLNVLLMGRHKIEDGNWEWITGSCFLNKKTEKEGKSTNVAPDWVPKEYHNNNQIQARLGPGVGQYNMFAPWADFTVREGLDEQPPFKLRFRVQRYPSFYIGMSIK